MAGKYYGVKKGRKIGVFNTWEECQEQIKGYSNAAYKKFSNYSDALNFIKEKDETIENKIDNLGENEIIAYVDGSFDLDKNYYSYGLVLFTTKGKEVYSKKGQDPDLLKMRNVAGEIKAAMFAMEKAIEYGKDIIYIYYDYLGIEKWATGEWKTRRVGTRDYKNYVASLGTRLKIVFIKVEAHMGNKYNEEADLLAREALKT